MNRESKFKAWDKKKGKFVFEGTFADIRHVGGKLNFTTWEWIQSTGLKDKNGKEIYEGDILSCKSKAKDGFEHRSTLRLGWSEDDEYGWCWDSGTIVRGVDFIDERYEVIGNIFENPELLEEENPDVN